MKDELKSLITEAVNKLGGKNVPIDDVVIEVLSKANGKYSKDDIEYLINDMDANSREIHYSLYDTISVEEPKPVPAPQNQNQSPISLPNTSIKIPTNQNQRNNRR